MSVYGGFPRLPFFGPVRPNVTPEEASASVLSLQGLVPPQIFGSLSLGEQAMRFGLANPEPIDQIAPYRQMLLGPSIEQLAGTGAGPFGRDIPSFSQGSPYIGQEFVPFLREFALKALISRALQLFQQLRGRI